MDRKLAVMLALAIGALVIGPASIAQQDDTPIKEAIDAMHDALTDGNAEALGALISDSGFVGLVPGDAGSQCFDKEALVTALAGQAQDMTVEFADTEVTLYWMVALATTTINIPDAGMNLDMVTVLMREGGEWKFVLLSVMFTNPQPLEEAVAEAVAGMSTLPASLLEGDFGPLELALHDEAFVMAFVDPGYEVRWTNSKEQLIEILKGVKDMVTIEDTHFDAEETMMGQDVAVVRGTWVLDITDLGETKSDMTGFAIKTDDGWKIVGLVGGPQG